jgi:hypothetical protein
LIFTVIDVDITFIHHIFHRGPSFFACAADAMPSAEERDRMLTLMKDSLRDSVLNDLHCSGNTEHPEHKEKQ